MIRRPGIPSERLGTNKVPRPSLASAAAARPPLTSWIEFPDPPDPRGPPDTVIPPTPDASVPGDDDGPEDGPPGAPEPDGEGETGLEGCGVEPPIGVGSPGATDDGTGVGGRVSTGGRVGKAGVGLGVGADVGFSVGVGVGRIEPVIVITIESGRLYAPEQSGCANSLAVQETLRLGASAWTVTATTTLSLYGSPASRSELDTPWSVTMPPDAPATQLRFRVTELIDAETTLNSLGIVRVTQLIASPPPLPVDMFWTVTFTMDAVPVEKRILSALAVQS